MGCLEGIITANVVNNGGLLFTTPHRAYQSAVEFTKAGDNCGKRLTNLPVYSSTLRHFFFQPPAVETAALDVMKKAKGFFEPEQAVEKDTEKKSQHVGACC